MVPRASWVILSSGDAARAALKAPLIECPPSNSGGSCRPGQSQQRVEVVGVHGLVIDRRASLDHAFEQLVQVLGEVACQDGRRSRHELASNRDRRIQRTPGASPHSLRSWGRHVHCLARGVSADRSHSVRGFPRTVSYLVPRRSRRIGRLSEGKAHN